MDVMPSPFNVRPFVEKPVLQIAVPPLEAPQCVVHPSRQLTRCHAGDRYASKVSRCQLGERQLQSHAQELPPLPLTVDRATAPATDDESTNGCEEKPPRPGAMGGKVWLNWCGIDSRVGLSRGCASQSEVALSSI